MGGGNALEVLEHYKNKILRYTNDESILLHCLNKLDMVKVTIQLLQETMIGKTVGLIKKQYGDGPVGVQAKALVTKWKEVVRVEEEQAQSRANSEDGNNESAGSGSPQSADNQSAEQSADNQSADDGESADSAVVKTEYVPTPLIPSYTPTPINQLETDSSSESSRKSHKHKKSCREKDDREENAGKSRDEQRKREKEENRNDKEGGARKEKEESRRDKDESRKDKDHKSSSSRSIKEEGKSSSRGDKERERKKHQEREDSKRKDKKEVRDEEKVSSRHKREETEEERIKRKKMEEESVKRKKETEEEREKRKKHSHSSKEHSSSSKEHSSSSKEHSSSSKEHSSSSKEHSSSSKEHSSSSKEHSSSRKIKEEPGVKRIKEEPSERSSKEETSSRSSKEHSSSRKIKEEPLFNVEQSASSRKVKEESSSSRNGRSEHSSSRRIKEEKSSSSSKSDRQGVSSSTSELNCDQDHATNNSGSESNCDTTTTYSTGEKDKTSDFKHKKDKKDRHKDKHRDSKRDKDRSHKSTEKRPELMELDMFSQIPNDSNKEKSRKRHRNEGESSDSSDKRRKVENEKPSSSYSSLPAALCMAPSLALAPGGPLAASGLALPEISPHYKPLPRAPLQSRHQPTDEDRLDELMGKKKTKNEIYSGKKRQRFFGEVPSLFDQCILKLQDHVDDIDEVGDLTFDILKPVLQRAVPQTLMHIEDLNQELMTGPTNTSELWEKHCQRDFRNKKREEMESWREMYERCTTEREQKLDILKGKIKKTTVTDKAALRHCKLAYPDVVAKPPRDVAIKQARHGTGLPTGTVTKVGAVVRPKVSDPTAGNSNRPSGVKKHKVPPMMAKAKTMMKGMSRYGRR